MAATVVKSKYMVDPENSLNLIRREDEGDRDYWDRVNQGDSVRGAASMFERSFSQEEDKKQPARVGKLRNRAGFMESLQGEEVVAREQPRVGKLNRQDVGTFSGIVEAVPAVVQPRMQIGKLDPKNMFDNPTEDKENESNRRSSMVIGKISAKNLFENNNSEDKIESLKSSIQVGKINTKDIFLDANESKHAASKIDIKVGKLKIKEEDLFESKEEAIEKMPLRVGKLNAKDLFATEESETTKAPIRVGKLNTKEMFTAEEDNTESTRTPIRVGKLNAKELFATEEEKPEETKTPRRVGKLNTKELFTPEEEKGEETKFYKPTIQPKKLKVAEMFSQEKESEVREDVRVGRLDTSKLFQSKEQEEREEREEKVTVGKLRLGGWEEKEEKEEEPKREVVRVGKLKQNIYEAKESEEGSKEQQEVRVGKVKHPFTESEPEAEPAPVVLRGGRRVNRGNRISCLIENLHTDKKAEDEEEEEKTEADKEEEVTLGRERMSKIQSMFSGEGGAEEPSSPSCSTACSELRDEGLVATNLHRFTTGNLRRTSQDSQQVSGARRASQDTAHIDKRHMEAVASRFEEGGQEEERSLEKGKPRRLRAAEELFQHSKEEYTDCVKTEVRVGKLSKDVFNPAPESPKEERPEVKVGRITTKDLFAQAEANSEELLREVRVGKLTKDRLTLASSTELDALDRSEMDTSLAPTGGVHEKASAFATTKARSPPKLEAPKIKRSESSAADDMQKKYEQQMASTALKRGNSSASLVVRNKPIKREPLVKVEPVAKRASVEEEMTVGEMLSSAPRVEAGKMQEARSSFFSSMIASSTASSTTPASVQRLGTSIVPAVSAEDREKFEKVESGKAAGGKSRGKALFQRMAEREKEEGEEEEEEERLAPVELLPGVDMEEMRMHVMMRQPAELLPGVDLEEIEDEFEALHRQMMDDGPPL